MTDSGLEQSLKIPEGGRMWVVVKPNSQRTKIIAGTRGIPVIEVAAPPEHNKANVELLKFLQRWTKRPCRVVAGASSKRKLVAFM